MNTNTTHGAIAQAEKIWRAAYDKNEVVGSIRTSRAEEIAWDTYVDLCHKIDQCLQPGCSTTSLYHSYCEEHRA